VFQRGYRRGDKWAAAAATRSGGAQTSDGRRKSSNAARCATLRVARQHLLENMRIFHSRRPSLPMRAPRWRPACGGGHQATRTAAAHAAQTLPRNLAAAARAGGGGGRLLRNRAESASKYSGDMLGSHFAAPPGRLLR